MKLSQIVLGISAIALICIGGCGGGGGSEAPPPQPSNQSPTVSVSNVTGVESTLITVSAIASDLDGTVTAYGWTQTSGPAVSLSGADSNTISFTAPAIVEVTELTFEVVVTDNDNATAKASMVVTVDPILINLNVNGHVEIPTNQAAGVTLHVGENQFIAIVAENGNFLAQISVDDSMSTSVVLATVVGTNSESPIKLRSYLGPLQSLVDNAGNDNVIDNNEETGLNINSITTAIAALIEDSNNGSVVTSQSEYAFHRRAYDTRELMDMARAIELVINYSDEIENLKLPEGISNTSALVEDLEEFRIFARKVQRSYAQHGEVYTDLVVEGNRYKGFTQNSTISIADDYYFVSQLFESNQGRMSLAEDGSGELINPFGQYAINWVSTENGVEITFQDGNVLESVSYPFDPNYGQVEVHHMASGMTLRWLSRSQNVDHLAITKQTYDHYPNGEYADWIWQGSYSFPLAVKSSGTVNAASVMAMDQEFVLPTPIKSDAFNNSKSERIRWPSATLDRSSSTMVFSGTIAGGGTVNVTTPVLEGDGTKSGNVKQLTWAIDGNGQLLIYDTNTYSYVFTNEIGDKMSLVNMVSTGTEPVAVSGDPLVGKQDDEWTSENIPGIYMLANDLFDGHTSYFWVELYQDGTALTANGLDSNEDRELIADEFSQMPGMWQLDSSGNLVVRRYRTLAASNQGAFYCTPSEWDPVDTAECVLYHERIWDLFRVTSDGRHYMNHMHKFYDDPYRNSMQDPNVAGHILGWATSFISYWTKVPQAPVDFGVLASKQNFSENKKLEKLEFLTR